MLQDDFNNQLWNVVMLAMGGSALGEAVKSSGLLGAIAHGIQDLIVGYGTWQVLAIFCALVLVATTFISHTVGAMVILPIVQAVGADMTVSHLLHGKKSLHRKTNPCRCSPSRGSQVGIIRRRSAASCHQARLQTCSLGTYNSSFCNALDCWRPGEAHASAVSKQMSAGRLQGGLTHEWAHFQAWSVHHPHPKLLVIGAELMCSIAIESRASPT